MIEDLTDELDRKYVDFKIKNPVIKFLEDIEKHIEDEFKRLSFYKLIHNISIENQYIPVNVVTERTDSHKAGSGFGFAVSERDHKIPYTSKIFAPNPNLTRLPGIR